MIELARSLLRLPWAASVFGASQLADLASRGGARKAEGNFYSVRVAAQDKFANDSFFFAGFQLGEEAQRAAIDLLFDVFQLKVLRPEWVSRTAERFARRSSAALKDLVPSENLRLYLDSLRNAFAVISLVNGAASRLALPPGPIDVSAALAKAYSFGEYDPLWLVEGLGEAYADENWSTRLPAGGLLVSLDASAELTDRSLLMLHAGLGLSVARHIIPRLTPVMERAEIEQAVRRLLELVRSNALKDFIGPAIESLGLVTRTWYQAMVPAVDEALWALDRDALEYFWHGVGRAIFFTALLPGTTAIESVHSEAPHELALLNATAGAAWAFTLVNIKQPELILHLVETQTRLLYTNAAFANGLISAILMANATLPGDPYAAALCHFRPSCGCSALLAAWDHLVSNPCQIANRVYLPVLRKHRRLGEVFRYQDLGALTEKLEARN